MKFPKNTLKIFKPLGMQWLRFRQEKRDCESTIKVSLPVKIPKQLFKSGFQSSKSFTTTKQ